MLNRLFKSELHRFGYFYSIFLPVIFLPIFNFFIAYMYKRNFNQSLLSKESGGISFANYPILFLTEILPLILNIFIIIFSSYFFYKEKEDGYISFILLRNISKINFVFTKIIFFYLYIIFIISILFVTSYISSFLIFEVKQTIKVFNLNIILSLNQWFLLSFKYYIISFLSLIPLMSISIIIRTFIENNILANSLAILFLVINIAYNYIKNIYLYMQGFKDELSFEKYDYISITQFQNKGIMKFLTTNDISIILPITIISLFLFIISIVIYSKRGLT